MRSRKLMSSLAASVLAASALLVTLTATSTAAALSLITLSGSARGLYGNPTGDAELNQYGVGLGLRLGVTLPASLYLGGSFDYFFGESDTNLGVDVSTSLLQVMGRVGYDLGVGPLLLRPQLGLGLAQVNSDLGPIIGDDSTSDFVLAPGLELTFGLGLLSVGAEVSYNKVFADDEVDADAVVLGLGLGFSI